MKNYLFAPFKDDDDKIESFSILKRYLSRGHKTELIMFIGRLESYYDVIISKLQSDECESIGWIDQYKKGCEEYRKEIAELKADSVAYDDDFDKLIKENDKLKAENKDLIANFKENKAEIKSLQDQLKDAVNDYEELLNSNNVK